MLEITQCIIKSGWRTKKFVKNMRLKKYICLKCKALMIPHELSIALCGRHTLDPTL